MTACTVISAVLSLFTGCCSPATCEHAKLPTIDRRLKATSAITGCMQAMRDGLPYAEARAMASAEDSARQTAQREHPAQDLPPFGDMMQRLDQVCMHHSPHL